MKKAQGAQKTNRSNNRRTGAGYEEAAAAYLKEQGYVILARNYRSRYGEIDLIAGKDSLIVYVEVKYRSSGACGDPAEAVDRKKRRRISRTALCHYAGCGGDQSGRSARFDVIAVGRDGRLRHIENAFEFQK